MSGIYGIFNFDGAPIEPQRLELMRAAMSYYGPDGGATRIDGNAGVGQLQLCIAPEDRFDAQPLVAASTVLVCSARLDNRDDLLDFFKIPAAERPATPDSRLVLAAYQRYGQECHRHLDGDWQFAAWDAREQRLFLCRDHHGSGALYYHQNSRYLAFASSQKALLALPDLPRRPNLVRVAQVLTSWAGDGVETAYLGIVRLPPAHFLSVSRQGAQATRYWFPEHLPTLKLPSDQAYVEHFLELYNEAVRTRLRSRGGIVVELSGGLDSGSVAALAAPLCAAQGKELTAFTSVPAFAPTGAGRDRFGDEWSLAAATAQLAGIRSHLPVRSEDACLLAAMQRQLHLHDEPGHAPGNYYWILDVMELARRRGATVLLSGQGGNGTISYGGNKDPLPHLRRGEYKQALRLLSLCEPNPWLALKRQVIKPLLLPAMRLYRHHLPYRGEPSVAECAINPALARELRLGERMREAGHDPTFTVSAGNPQVELVSPGKSILGALSHEIGAAYGMEVRDPTADRRIIEFCLSLPQEQFRRRGTSRYLVVRGMQGYLPEAVLHNRKRGLQAADLGHRVLREAEAIGEALRLLERNELAAACLNVAEMQSVLDSVQNGVTEENTIGCITTLLRGLGVGMFLSQF